MKDCFPLLALVQPVGAMFVLAAVCLYAAGRVLIASADPWGDRPALRGASAAVPALLLAGLAAFLGQGLMSVSILLAYAATGLTLVLGFLFMSIAGSPGSGESDRRQWAMLLPTTLLVFLVGLRGELSAVHALLLLIQGAAVALAWRPAEHPVEFPARSFRQSSPLIMLLAVLLALVGAAVALRAAQDFSRQIGLPDGQLAGVVLLAPMLTLPLLGTSMQTAQRNQWQAAVSTLVMTCVVALCLGLPLVIGLWQIRLEPAERHTLYQILALDHLARPALESSTTQPATAPRTASTRPSEDRPALALPFPLRAWRVETVLSITAALLLVPVAFGRWRPGRLEGVGLVLGYLMYLATTLYLSRA